MNGLERIVGFPDLHHTFEVAVVPQPNTVDIADGFEFHRHRLGIHSCLLPHDRLLRPWTSDEHDTEAVSNFLHPGQFPTVDTGANGICPAQWPRRGLLQFLPDQTVVKPRRGIRIGGIDFGRVFDQAFRRAALGGLQKLVGEQLLEKLAAVFFKGHLHGRVSDDRERYIRARLGQQPGHLPGIPPLIGLFDTVHPIVKSADGLHGHIDAGVFQRLSFF